VAPGGRRARRPGRSIVVPAARCRASDRAQRLGMGSAAIRSPSQHGGRKTPHSHSPLTT
jgi:hypothetical protein